MLPQPTQYPLGAIISWARSAAIEAWHKQYGRGRDMADALGEDVRKIVTNVEEQHGGNSLVTVSLHQRGPRGIHNEAFVLQRHAFDSYKVKDHTLNV